MPKANSINLSETAGNLMGAWYAYKNISDEGGVNPYTGVCPPYYDLRGEPWFDKLRAMIPELRERTLEMLYERKPELPQFLGALVQEGRWESKAFLAWNVRRELAKGKGRDVYACVRDMPGIVSLFISVLKPGTHVKPHNGDTDATYRIHVPIIIPAGLPECGMKVNGIDKPWQNDELLTFCDAHRHEVWNHTKDTRVILIIDVIRAEYRARKRSICARVLSWVFIQKILEYRPFSMLPLAVKIPFARLVIVAVRPFFWLLQQR